MAINFEFVEIRRSWFLICIYDDSHVREYYRLAGPSQQSICKLSDTEATRLAEFY
jgi:hypothetical protein